MRLEIYDADTGDLLEKDDDKEALLPEVGQQWALEDGVKTVVKARPEGDAAKGTVFFKVWVR